MLRRERENLTTEKNFIPKVGVYIDYLSTRASGKQLKDFDG